MKEKIVASHCMVYYYQTYNESEDSSSVDFSSYNWLTGEGYILFCEGYTESGKEKLSLFYDCAVYYYDNFYSWCTQSNMIGITFIGE